MYQKYTIIGNATRDAEERLTAQGKPVTTFTVAVNDRYGEKDQVLWINVTTWGKLAEITAKYVKKGKLVLVEGRLKPDSSGNPTTFTRKDGSVGASYEMTADNVRFLTGKAEEEPADEIVF